MAKIPTVKVQHGDDFMIINEADFDAAVHTLYGESGEDASPEGSAPAAPPPAGPPQPGSKPDAPVLDLKHVGFGKYHVTVDGEPLKHDGGEDDGKPVVFASKDEAQAALDEYAAAA